MKVFRLKRSCCTSRRTALLPTGPLLQAPVLKIAGSPCCYLRVIGRHVVPLGQLLLLGGQRWATITQPPNQVQALEQLEDGGGGKKGQAQVSAGPPSGSRFIRPWRLSSWRGEMGGGGGYRSSAAVGPHHAAT